MADDADDLGIDLFQEPDGFYQPEKEASFASHTLLSGKELSIRLVGHNPLWVRSPCCRIATFRHPSNNPLGVV
jgi:hypothetical protein